MDNKEDKLIKQIRKRLKELRAKKKKTTKKKKPIKKKAIKKKQPLQRQTQRQEVNIILGEELKTIRKKRRRTTPRPKAPTIQRDPVVFHSIPQLNEVSSLKNTFYDFQSRIEALDDRIKTGFTVGNETLNSLEDRKEKIQERQASQLPVDVAAEELKEADQAIKKAGQKMQVVNTRTAKSIALMELSNRSLEDRIKKEQPIQTLEEELKQPERAVSLEDAVEYVEPLSTTALNNVVLEKLKEQENRQSIGDLLSDLTKKVEEKAQTRKEAQEAAAEALKEIERRTEQKITQRERQPDPVIREQLKKDEEPSPGSFGGSPVPAVPISQQQAEGLTEAEGVESFPPPRTTSQTTGREAAEEDEPGEVLVVSLKKGDYTGKYKELNQNNKKKFKDNYKEFFKASGQMYANTTIIKYKAEADRRNNADAFLNNLLEGQAVRSEGQKKRSKKSKKKKDN